MKTFFATLACASAALAVSSSSLRRGDVVDFPWPVVPEDETVTFPPKTCEESIEWLKQEKGELGQLPRSYVTLLSLQSEERSLGGKGSREFLNWAKNHTYNGMQLRIQRPITEELRQAFKKKITGPRVMS